MVAHHSPAPFRVCGWNIGKENSGKEDLQKKNKKQSGRRKKRLMWRDTQNINTRRHTQAYTCNCTWVDTFVWMSSLSSLHELFFSRLFDIISSLLTAARERVCVWGRVRLVGQVIDTEFTVVVLFLSRRVLTLNEGPR
uniref:Uncharacterized protein n=1 Tax=Trypanosoma congolense (strain IL3000) TaxID=1068625 RepID=G0V265_TRYCI|nr:hypothetical protein, unlikely [Trypanosoma congolense IL3000]